MTYKVILESTIICPFVIIRQQRKCLPMFANGIKNVKAVIHF